MNFAPKILETCKDCKHREQVDYLCEFPFRCALNSTLYSSYISCKYFEKVPKLDFRIDMPETQLFIDLKVKKIHKDAILPSYATDGSAGLDLYCYEDITKEDWGRCISYQDEYNDYGKPIGRVAKKHGYKCRINTGIAMEIPKGYVGEMKSKSGLYKDFSITAFNGIIDSDYRGELIVGLESNTPRHFNAGSKIAQLLIYPLPKCTIKEVSELSDTERGSGGFGSTGK